MSPRPFELRTLLTFALALALPVIASAQSSARAVIPPGQEALLVEMLGGAPIAGCTPGDVRVEQDEIEARYACSEGEVAVVLRHPSASERVLARTEQFGISPGGGRAPPPALVAALVPRIRAGEGRFRWVAPAATGSPEEAARAEAAGAFDGPHTSTAAVVALAWRELWGPALLAGLAMLAARVSRDRWPRVRAWTAGIALGSVVGLALRASGEAIAGAALSALWGALLISGLAALALGAASALVWSARRRSAPAPREGWIALLVALSLGVGWVAVEIYVAGAEASRFPRFGDISTGHAPGMVVDGDPRRLRVDDRWGSRGFRGPEWTDRAAPGTRRVVLVGDSFVAGMGVAWPDTLGEQLRPALAALGARASIETINLGLPGNNLASHVEIVRTAEERLAPDAIVLCLTLPNDLSESDSQQELDDAARPGSYGIGRALFGRHFAAWLSGTRLARELDERALAVLDRELARLVAARGESAALPLFVFAYGFSDEPLRERLAGAPGVRVVSPVSARPEHAIPGDGHPTALANAEYAAHLARAMLAVPELARALDAARPQ